MPQINPIDPEVLRAALVAAAESDLQARVRRVKALRACPGDVLLKALEVFESAEGAALWLIGPTNRVVGLNGRAPIEVVDTAEGVQAVLAVLNRIDLGIPP